MNKLTFQVIALVIVIFAITATEVSAQRLTLRNGKATVNANVVAKGKKVITISGKDFQKLNIKQTKGGKFEYEIRRGSKFLSSGHSTGFRQITSDNKSTYSIIIINSKDVARRIILAFQDGDDYF